jgi:membrane protein implicated in regulation of membrane protease activity
LIRLNRVGDVLNGVQGMVGDTALVTREIRGEHNPGRVRARGEEWFAIPLDPDSSIEVGTQVVVADVERGLLVVYAPDS